jgi:hypothetical protein
MDISDVSQLPPREHPNLFVGRPSTLAFHLTCVLSGGVPSHVQSRLFFILLFIFHPACPETLLY